MFCFGKCETQATTGIKRKGNKGLEETTANIGTNITIFKPIELEKAVYVENSPYCQKDHNSRDSRHGQYHTRKNQTELYHSAIPIDIYSIYEIYKQGNMSI